MIMLFGCLVVLLIASLLFEKLGKAGKSAE